MPINCKKADEYSYLYAELSPEEKSAFEMHVKQCASCSERWQEIRMLNTTLHTASAIRKIPENSARLTRSIMQALEQPVPNVSGWRLSIHQLLNLPVLRYALATVSLLLLLEFYSEQSIPSTANPSASHQAQSTVDTPYILNTNAFLKLIPAMRQDQRAREKQLSIIDCLKTEACNQFRHLKTKKTYAQR